MISTRLGGLVIDTVVRLTLAKWETVSGQFGGYLIMVESAARANDLPVQFFTRVIWQENRFDANAMGPLTGSGKQADGIAQFIPAAALGERDPMILRTLLRSRGTQPIYQIRIGTDTRAEADGLCRQLRAQGGACIVLRSS